MARTPEALVEPSVLAWARGSAGLAVDVAAKKISVKPERIEQWESGEARPSIAQLRKAATVYKRPLAVFFLPEPPQGFDALRDFRLLPESGDQPWSPELRVEVRRAQEQQQTALELLELLGEGIEPLPTIDASQSDPEVFGDAIRSHLGVTLDVQKRWPASQPHVAFRAWADAIEALGVLVMHARKVDLDEMRGFSLAEPLPTIVLNGSDSPRGRVFTLLHELAHLFIHATGICDVRERSQTTTQDARIETFCNRVAAAVLMPRTAFEQRARGIGSGPEWSDDQIESLSGEFSVSREAALRRLLTLGMTTHAFYEARRSEYLKQYRAQREKERESDGGPGYYRIKVGSLGHEYINIALETHAQGHISRFELADVLDVKVRNVEKLLDEMRGSGRSAGAA